MRKIVFISTAVLMLVFSTAAAQANGHPKHPKHEKGNHPACNNYHPCPPVLELPPPIQATPPVNTNEAREAYCVQTKERGETFVQAGFDSFKPGGDWYALWTSGATVVLDGHTVTLMYEDGLNGRQKGIGNGVILAANVPHVGLTCAQPYVSTDGAYLNKSYGER